MEAPRRSMSDLRKKKSVKKFTRSISLNRKDELELIIPTNSTRPTGRINVDAPIIQEIEKGFNTVVQIPDQSDDRIIDLAGDFEGFVRNKIWTSSYTIATSLKEKNETKKIKLHLMKDQLKSIISFTKKTPKYLRYERVDILYIPHFEAVEGLNPEITIQLFDTSTNRVIQEVIHPATEMAISLLSMSYTILSSDAECIVLRFKSTEVPVCNRAYASICIMTHIDANSIGLKVETNKPICLLLNNCPRPSLLNSKSIIRTVTGELKAIKDKKLSKLEERVKEERDNREGKVILEMGESSKSENEKNENSEENPLYTIGFNLEALSRDSWIIDSGSALHVIARSAEKKDKIIHTANGNVIRGTILQNVTVDLNDHNICLPEAFVTDEIEINILSLGLLQSHRIIDTMKLSDERTMYYSGDDLVFMTILSEEKLSIVN
nr:TPA_asm: movement protein [Viola ophiovirus]